MFLTELVTHVQLEIIAPNTARHTLNGLLRCTVFKPGGRTGIWPDGSPPTHRKYNPDSRVILLEIKHDKGGQVATKKNKKTKGVNKSSLHDFSWNTAQLLGTNLSTTAPFPHMATREVPSVKITKGTIACLTRGMPSGTFNAQILDTRIMQSPSILPGPSLCLIAIHDTATTCVAKLGPHLAAPAAQGQLVPGTIIAVTAFTPARVIFGTPPTLLGASVCGSHRLPCKWPADEEGITNPNTWFHKTWLRLAQTPTGDITGLSFGILAKAMTGKSITELFSRNTPLFQITAIGKLSTSVTSTRPGLCVTLSDGMFASEVILAMQCKFQWNRPEFTLLSVIRVTDAELSEKSLVVTDFQLIGSTSSIFGNPTAISITGKRTRPMKKRKLDNQVTTSTPARTKSNTILPRLGNIEQ